MEHFNRLTPAEAERLAMLAEEMGECIQAVGKILRHGYESSNPDKPADGTNREQLEKEIAEVQWVVSLMETCSDISTEALSDEFHITLKKKYPYLHHQACHSGA